MFDWLRKKRSDNAQTNTQPQRRAPHAAPPLQAGPLPFGSWVLMELPWNLPERFLGYVYFDEQAGASAKGGPESDAQLAERPTHTLRLPMPGSMQVLSSDEVSRRGLPPVPTWVLQFYGPQPDPAAPWRSDPTLQGRLLDKFPDDLQVIVHDGEPRRTNRGPELCWVRVLTTERGPARRFIFNPEATSLSRGEFDSQYETNQTVYVARLLNAPSALQSVHQGDSLRFLSGGGLEQPLHVTTQYLLERGNWDIGPCNRCGMGECLDPPSVMARLRFPDLPPESEVTNFTSFCAMCGGIQMLSLQTDSAR